MMNNEEVEFYNTIRSRLAENPSLLRIALEAITKGMDGALRKVEFKVRDYETAYLSALSLAKDKRLSQDMLNILNNRIVEIIIKYNSHNLCDRERDFLEENNIKAREL